MKLEKKYGIFVGNILSGYSIVDMLYGAAYIILMKACGLDAFGISFVIAISSISLAIFDYPSGNFADRYGRKKTTALGFLIWGIGLIGFGFSKNIILFTAFSIVSSAGISLISGSPQAWYIDKLRELDRLSYKNKVVPILNGVVSIFAALGAAIAAITSTFDVSLAIIIAGMLAVVIALFTYSLYEDNYGERLEKSFVKEVITSTRNFLHDKQMIGILYYYLLSNLSRTAFLLVWQLYALNDIGVQYELIGIILVVFLIAQAIAGFASGKLLDKFTNFQLTVIGGIINIGALFSVFFWGKNIVSFCIIIFIFEFGLGLIMSNSQAWMQDFIPSAKRSTYTSAITAINSVSCFMCTLLLGLIITQFGRNIIWLIAGVFQLSALLYQLFIMKKHIKIK